MEKNTDIKIGDFFMFKTSDGFYRMIFCTSIVKNKNAHSFNFCPTTIKTITKPSIQDIKNSFFYGKGNRRDYEFSKAALEKMRLLHPEIKPCFLGVYEFLITEKAFISFKENFEFVCNLQILEKLHMNGSGSMNASSFNVLNHLFINRIENFMKLQNQKEYKIEAIIK